MDRLLVTRQRVDAAHRSPDIVRRLGAGVEGSHTLRKERRLLPIKLSVDPPLRWSILFPHAQLVCPPPLLFRNLLIQPDFDGLHVLSINHPQLYRRIRGHFLEAFAPPYDASMISCAARFDLSALPMNGCRFQPSASYSRPLARPTSRRMEKTWIPTTTVYPR